MLFYSISPLDSVVAHGYFPEQALDQGCFAHVFVPHDQHLALLLLQQGWVKASLSRSYSPWSTLNTTRQNAAEPTAAA